MGRRRSPNTYIPILIAVAVLLLVFIVQNVVSQKHTAPAAQPGSIPGAVSEPKWGVQTRTSACQVNGPLQDTACTPGDIFPNVTKSTICVPGYAGSVRDVSTSLKNKVYAEYGIVKRSPGQYEVDHLVSLQLGGSNDISNLWPEAVSPKPGSREKDRVENYLHDQVCNGSITLKQAQIEIATNWLDIYKRLPAK